MFKKTLCVLIALLTLMSVVSVGVLSVSAEEVADGTASFDEATKDEAELVISTEPKVAKYSVNGTAIGYIGDTNVDDKINVKDATVIQKYLAKLISLGEQAKHLADADDNGKLNVRDATTIQKYIAGIEVNSYIWHLLYETGTHNHNYVETVVEPGCETVGYTGFSCICGDEYKENEVDAKGHSYSSKVFAATCVDEGYILNKCVNCNYSYKTGKTPATGVHNYNSKYVCAECGVKKSVESFNTLKEFIKENGEYVSELNAYYYELTPTQAGDAATLVYSKDDDAVAIVCAYVIDEYIDLITIAISPEGECGFYMICQDVYESAGTLDMSKFTFNSKTVKEIDYYMIGDVKESEALANTVAYIKGALSTYEYNAYLPVSIQDLGFTSFELK